MSADFAARITAARLREIVARNREGLDGAHYLPVHADDLRVLLELAEREAGQTKMVWFCWWIDKHGNGHVDRFDSKADADRWGVERVGFGATHVHFTAAEEPA